MYSKVQISQIRNYFKNNIFFVSTNRLLGSSNDVASIREKYSPDDTFAFQTFFFDLTPNEVPMISYFILISSIGYLMLVFSPGGRGKNSDAFNTKDGIEKVREFLFSIRYQVSVHYSGGKILAPIVSKS
jgi:hypothetical protein